MLLGWQDSKGASFEREYTRLMGKQYMYEVMEKPGEK
jgi:hypothetical protein